MGQTKICRKCGYEFEGNFCPECGEKHSNERYCSNCGALQSREFKFCSECGAAMDDGSGFEKKQVAPKRVIGSDNSYKMWKKIYFVLDLLPVALIALFAILNFAFLVAPFATAKGFTGESESLGNFYAIQSVSDFCSMIENGALYVIAVLSYVFTALAFIYAVASCVLTFVPEIKRKLEWTYVPAVMKGASAVFYIAFLVLGILVASLISEVNKMAGGMITLGAQPILAIVFSSVFLTFTAASPALKYVTEPKCYPFGSLKEPNQPEELLEKPIKFFPVGDLETLYSCKRRLGVSYFFLMLVLVIMILAIIWYVVYETLRSNIIFAFQKMYDDPTWKEVWEQYGNIRDKFNSLFPGIAANVIVLCSAVYFIVNAKIKIKKYDHTTQKRKIIIFVALVGGSVIQSSVAMISLWGFFALIPIIVYGIVLAICVYPMIKTYRKLMGLFEPRETDGETVTPTFEDIAEEQIVYDEYMKLYRENVKEWRKFRHDKNLFERCS